MNSSTRARLVIDLAALTANYLRMQSLAPTARVAGVVKADGYGLGMLPVAHALASAGCTHFYVAQLEEAIQLRQSLPDVHITVLHGISTGQEKDFLAHRLEPALNHPGQWEIWEKAAYSHNTPLPATLHLDTGMHRLGFSAPELSHLINDPSRTAFSLTRLMSHLACADTPEHPLNHQQHERLQHFHSLCPTLPVSFCNSAGILLGPDYHFNEVRPGSALYGMYPSAARHITLHTVASLYAPILQLRSVDAPGTVGYGATSSIPKGGTIAVLPLGYADGYFRTLGPRAQVFLHLADGTTATAPLIGRVSMDLLCLDVSHIPLSQLHGAEAELMGPHLSTEQLAEQAGTMNLEVITRLGHRFERHYINAHTSVSGQQATAAVSSA